MFTIYLLDKNHVQKEVVNIHIKDILHIMPREEREKAEEEKRERSQLMEDIDYTVARLAQIQESFDLVSDGDLVESMIYEELALKARYAYLLRQAKEKKIQCRMAVRQ